MLSPTIARSPSPRCRIAIVCGDDANAATLRLTERRFHRIISALMSEVGLAASPALFRGAEEQVRARLFAVGGVLVWVDPVDAMAGGHYAWKSLKGPMKLMD